LAIFTLPVSALAARMAFSVASVPELVKRTISTEGTRWQISFARRTWYSLGALYTNPLDACSWTACTTGG
jgi:hypothetical protein